MAAPPRKSTTDAPTPRSTDFRRPQSEAHVAFESGTTREFRPLPPALMWRLPDRLEQVDGPGAPRTLPVDAERTTIGRDAEADFVLDSEHVSRLHVQIVRDMGDIICKDLGSRNGLWLNNLRVHAASLREGDTLQVGDALFIFHRGH